MIGFRYHVISVVAIFFALAAGIALGAGPLQAQLTDALARQASEDRIDTQQARTQLDSAQARLAFADDFAGSTSSAVLGSALSGRTVSLVVLPGADRGGLRALRDEIVAAKGSVVSTVTLTRDVLDPANRQLADGLAQRVLKDNTTGGDGTESYQLLGTALARSFLVAGDRTAERDGDAEGIQAAFEEAGLIKVNGPVERRAQLTLVVAGEPAEQAPGGQADVAAEIIAALDARAAGAVVAGPSASADTGVVAAVRHSSAGSTVSSVDALDLPAGRVVTVLALAEQARGGVGQYGMGASAESAAPRIDR